MVSSPFFLLRYPVIVTPGTVSLTRAVMLRIDPAVINILPGRGVKTGSISVRKMGGGNYLWGVVYSICYIDYKFT